jgi:cold shock protein
MEGKVKFYVETKGFGFITDAVTKTDVFFHKSGCLDKIVTDDLVSYEVENGKRGMKAINVSRTKDVERYTVNAKTGKLTPE